MYQIARTGRGYDYVGGQPIQYRPKQPLYGELPFAGVPWGERGRIGAEQKCRARKFAGKISDPEPGANVAGMANHRVEISLANKSPKAWIVQTPKSPGVGAFVGDFDPGVAVEQGNIPLNFRAKFGINAGFCAAQPALDGADLKLRVLRHSPQQWRHILHGVAADEKHLVPAVRHIRALPTGGRW
jgi:hypothetical protein